MRELHIGQIKAILEECPEARSNDDYLFAEYLKRYDTSLPDFERGVICRCFEKWKSLKYDSMRRSRQRVQERYPELRPPAHVRRGRNKRADEIVEELNES